MIRNIFIISFLVTTIRKASKIISTNITRLSQQNFVRLSLQCPALLVKSASFWCKILPNILALLIFSSFLVANIRAQDTLNYLAKAHTRPIFGVNIPITRLLDGRFTDNVIRYSDNSIYWQLLPVAYFFHKHWGVELNLQGMTSASMQTKAADFEYATTDKYKDDYYATTTIYSDNINPIIGDFTRVFIGLVYRYEKNRFSCYPKFAIGTTEFSTTFAKTMLKQRNANTILEVSYNHDSYKRNYDFFTTATSVSFGYRLTKRLFLNLDVMGSYYRGNVILTKKTTDLSTNASVSEEIIYRNDIYTASIGGGIIFALYWDKKNKK